MSAALKAHGEQHEVRRTKHTGFGPRFEVEGEMVAPDGRKPRNCSVCRPRGVSEGLTRLRLVGYAPSTFSNPSCGYE